MADNTSQIAGLFMTPEMYQQQQNELAFNRASKLAAMDPFEAAKTGIGYGAYQLAGALGGAMGGQDPMLAQLSTIQQLGSQFDLSTSTGNMQLAKALQDKGMAGPASQFAAKAATLRKDEATAMPEKQRLAMSMADTKAQRGTQEWLQAYQDSLGEVINPERLTTDQKNFAQAKKEGFAGTFQQWLEHQKLLGRNVTNINMPAGESEFVKELAKHDAKTVSDAFKTREGAIEELRTLQKMSELNQKPIISGSGAQLRSDVANFFDTIGISSNKDTMKTSNSQEYTKYASGLVLDKIKKLGTNPSNTDRDFANRIVPQLENSPQARTELIQYLAKRANEVVSETNRMEQYARKNRGLSGYEPTIPLVGTKGSSALSGYTDEQLKAIAGIK